MSSEYGVEVSFERVPFSGARWALAGWGAVDAAALRRRIARIVAGGAANATSSSVAAMGSWSVAVTSASLFLDKV